LGARSPIGLQGLTVFSRARLISISNEPASVHYCIDRIGTPVTSPPIVNPATFAKNQRGIVVVGTSRTWKASVTVPLADPLSGVLG
jgi:hypothetical protein